MDLEIELNDTKNVFICFSELLMVKVLENPCIIVYTYIAQLLRYN